MELLSQFGIIKQVSSEWRDLGRRFGLTTNILEKYDRKALLDNDICCEKVFTHWINDGGRPPKYPLSWKGAHAALCDINQHGIADDMILKLSLHH
jgi:hypothetical protein